ncbi:hypothetical protein SAMN06298216_1334 [Spirosomataceae bacterium TFI 002]|nr:hypothetical protein SAMN06298216_1334 [Spirosomataceae bacterium TFI 002]
MRYIFVLFILLFSSIDSKACDICGCGNGGSFFGILPNSHVRLLGLKYKYKSFNSHLGSKTLSAQEDFQSVELWGRAYPFKNTQVLYFVPYNFNSQTRLGDNKSSSINGLGDATVLVQYNLLNTFMDTTRIRTWEHNLLVGTGLKAPVGKFDYDQNSLEEVANPNFQLGTGSWDIPLNITYTIKHKNNGINVNSTYKINGKNNNDYKFANRINTSISAFKTLALGSYTLLPMLGVYGEYAGQDRQSGIANGFTGGGFVAANAGLDIYLNKYTLGINTQLPIAQNLVNGELSFKKSFNFQLTRMF